MPRPLVFGNGRLLIQLDRDHAIRDFFWPHVGKWNHLQGYRIRLGIWVEGNFSWVDDRSWIRSQSYETGTLIGISTLIHEGLGVKLTLTEAIHPEKDQFARQIKVENLEDSAREIRLFSTHDFRLEENDMSDTAFVTADHNAIVHYKFGTNIRISAVSTRAPSIYEYACGIKAWAEMEGTWRDAEDGHLSNISIAQGSVDSTLSMNLSLPAMGAEVVSIVLEASSQAFGIGFAPITATDVEQIISSSRDWSRGICREAESSLFTDIAGGQSDISSAQKDFYFHSLFMILTQCNHNGAILAANDSDILQTNRATYSFVWPRDGALVAMVTDEAGLHETSTKYFDFCLGILNKSRDGAVFDQKYTADGEIGASWHPVIKDGKQISAHQEDELNLTIIALWEHIRQAEDTQRATEIWSLMRESVMAYYPKHTDPISGLPTPSYDLWEERLGVHLYTVVTRISAYKAMAQLEELIGNSDNQYQKMADDLLTIFMKEFYDHGLKRFIRMIAPDGHRDMTPDSAILSVALLGAISPNSTEFRSTVAAIERDLRIGGPIDGVARYAHDYYFRRSEDYAGNPWIICTMWLAQSKIVLAEDLDQLGQVKFWLDWVLARAETTGVLAEQFHPETGEPLSVSPLTWSHAEYCRTVQHYVAKFRELNHR